MEAALATPLSIQLIPKLESRVVHPASDMNPAGIFDSGSLLLNQKVNGCIHTYVNNNQTVAERMSKNHNQTVAKRICKIGSRFVQDWFGPERIILIQDWFGHRAVL